MNNKILAIVLVVLVLVVGVNHLRSSNSEQSSLVGSDETGDITYVENDDDEDDEVITEISEDNNTYYYAEGTEDMDYNYITNAYYLSEFDTAWSYNVLMTMGDEINTYLETAGYKGNELTIEKAGYKVGTDSVATQEDVESGDSGYTTVLMAISMSDSEDILIVTYDISTKTYSMYIETA